MSISCPRVHQDRTRRRATAFVAPRLASDEELVSTGAAWIVPLRPRVPVLLLGRRRYLVALTDRRLLVFFWHGRRRRLLPRRGPADPEAAVAFARRLEGMAQHRLRTRPSFQVRVRTAPQLAALPLPLPLPLPLLPLLLPLLPLPLPLLPLPLPLPLLPLPLPLPLLPPAGGAAVAPSEP